MAQSQSHSKPQPIRVVERLLRLITLLQGSEGPWGRQTLARVLGQSTKTISRDLDRLKAGGREESRWRPSDVWDVF